MSWNAHVRSTAFNSFYDQHNQSARRCITHTHVCMSRIQFVVRSLFSCAHSSPPAHALRPACTHGHGHPTGNKTRWCNTVAQRQAGLTTASAGAGMRHYSHAARGPTAALPTSALTPRRSLWRRPACSRAGGGGPRPRRPRCQTAAAAGPPACMPAVTECCMRDRGRWRAVLRRVYGMFRSIRAGAVVNSASAPLSAHWATRCNAQISLKRGQAPQLQQTGL